MKTGLRRALLQYIATLVARVSVIQEEKSKTFNITLSSKGSLLTQDGPKNVSLTLGHSFPEHIFRGLLSSEI